MTTRPEEGPDKVLEIIMVLAREVMARSGLPDVGAVGSAAPAEGLKAG